eukprot:snap_masked-scaffold_11-processed-gene-2.23-mRNA-1 protein AED:1.00 eAED:1.00 QI:0/-1/0/0/-1/1/1/0/207
MERNLSQTENVGVSPPDVPDVSDPEYIVNKKAPNTIKELLEKDSEDESLKRYKERLLGSATTIISPSKCQGNMIPKGLRIIFRDNLAESIYMPFQSAEDKLNFSMKEGSQYKIELEFLVENTILSGLDLELKVSRDKALGLLKTSENLRMGTFAPKLETQKYCFPREYFLEAPKGVVHRGKYSANITIKDAEKIKYFDLPFNFSITK